MKKDSMAGGGAGPGEGMGPGGTQNDDGTQAGGVDMGGSDAQLMSGMVAKNKEFLAGPGNEQGFDVTKGTM